jgi:hypothetical protein
VILESSKKRAHPANEYFSCTLNFTKWSQKDRYAILLTPRFEVLKGTHLPDEPKKEACRSGISAALQASVIYSQLFNFIFLQLG